MAKPFRQKRYLGLFLFFFIVGTIWGRFFYYGEATTKLFSDESLTFLAPAQSLPREIVEHYEADFGVTLNIIEYSDLRDFIEKLWDNSVDLIIFRSEHADDITDLLAALDKKKVKGFDRISVDFKNLHSDSGNTQTIPLYWGIENVKSKKPQLWIESVGIAQKSKNKPLAYELINYLLEPEVVVTTIRIRQVASTNRMVENNSNVQSKWKPSYIRKISIKNLSVQASR